MSSVATIESATPEAAAAKLNTFGELSLAYYAHYFAERGIKPAPLRFNVNRSLTEETSVIERYLAAQPADWISELETAAGALPIQSPQCRLSVLVPCRFEEHRIKDCLDALRSQNPKANAEQFEVLVLDNFFEGESPDATERLVREYALQQGLPYRLHCLRKVFRGDDTNFGMSLSRKFLADLTLLRCLKRPSRTAPLYIASMDADVVSVQARTLDAVVQYMDQKPWVDALRGMQDRQPEVLCQNSLLWLERRSWYIAEKLLSSRKYWPDRNPSANFTWHRNVTGGWNTYFSAQIYAAIGGHARIRFLDDVDIGNRISVLRAGADTKPNFEVRSIERLPMRMSSSPSRFMHALIKDADPYSGDDNYASFYDAEVEEVVKRNDIPALLEMMKPTADPHGPARAKYDAVLQRVHSALVDIDPVRADALMRSVMMHLGFARSDYELATSTLKVASYVNFQATVQANRRRYQLS
jgi:glycosyltransferase involved in cell wall biosynthesis